MSSGGKNKHNGVLSKLIIGRYKFWKDIIVPYSHTKQ